MTFLSLLTVIFNSFNKIKTLILLQIPTISRSVTLGILDLHGPLQEPQVSLLQHVRGVVVLFGGIRGQPGAVCS